ncbi:MAG: hypothetical protein GEV03_25935 [Streptosporangiales bacterium]|nr:hypothetical protein [Streptosporangiales bacterium]
MSTRRRLGAMIAVMVASVLFAPASSGRAVPSQPTDPGEELDRLDRQADDLARQYRGELHELTDGIQAARRAAREVREVEGKQAAARARLAELAAARYKSGRIDPVIMLATSDDPRVVLDQAATAEHLARNDQDRLREMQSLMEARRRAQQEAQARVTETRRLVARLEAKKDKVAELIEKYEAEEAAREEREAQSSGSSGYTPTPHAKSPVIGGGSSITPRMQDVLTEVDQRFGPFSSIGCYRATNDGGEHPLGRACDFMLSTGGSMPSSENVDHGWAVANWARDNADRLGVMYIIYRQQIWDVRSGGGWRAMEDRGSITANHYDHVHISVF